MMRRSVVFAEGGSALEQLHSAADSRPFESSLNSSSSLNRSPAFLMNMSPGQNPQYNPNNSYGPPPLRPPQPLGAAAQQGSVVGAPQQYAHAAQRPPRQYYANGSGDNGGIAGPGAAGGQRPPFAMVRDGTPLQDGVPLSSTNLYIRGLPPDTTDEDLRRMCEEYGDIASTKAITDKVTGQCKGYGFVDFENRDDAVRAVDGLNRQGIQAQMAKQQEQDPTNLYIANLPIEFNEQDLDRMLNTFGMVISTRVLRNAEGVSRGVGFARMDSKEKCVEIIQALNNQRIEGMREDQPPLVVKQADTGRKTNRKRSDQLFDSIGVFQSQPFMYDAYVRPTNMQPLYNPPYNIYGMGYQQMGAFNAGNVSQAQFDANVNSVVNQMGAMHIGAPAANENNMYMYGQQQMPNYPTKFFAQIDDRKQNYAKAVGHVGGVYQMGAGTNGDGGHGINADLQPTVSQQAAPCAQ